MSERQYGALADRAARRYGVDPRLFRLLIRAESNWDPSAGSPAGARGLTQVVPRWHPDADLSTPQGQLDYGAKHLASLLRKYGNPRDALAVYNSGKPWSVSKDYGETNAYVTKILGQYGGGRPSRSGGVPTTDAGMAPPSIPASPLSALDTKRLLMLLRNQTARSLRGIMPAEGFRPELQKIAAGAIPRAGATASAKAVGAQAGHSASAVQNVAGTYGFPSGPVDSGKVDPGGDGGDWGGSMPRALALARAVGATPSSQKRSRRLTASGNPSDHWVGSTSSYATDLPTSGAAGDALFAKIRRVLGVSIRPGVWNNVNIDGYRYQVGWRVPGHYDHIHVGVKRL